MRTSTEDAAEGEGLEVDSAVGAHFGVLAKCVSAHVRAVGKRRCIETTGARPIETTKVPEGQSCRHACFTKASKHGGRNSSGCLIGQ